MRQFDVLVWGPQANCTDIQHEPPFTDRALGWFFGNDLNASLAKSEAEWILLAHESIVVDRAFLNNLAECISGYPMVDALAPRVKIPGTNSFISGMRLDKRTGLSMLDENAKMRFVASPFPYIAAFSRRIIQRTGALDAQLPIEFQIVDLSLRMLHAGGKMFSVPYLVAMATNDCSIPVDILQRPRELAYTLTKAFGTFQNIRYLSSHPKAAYFVWKTRKELTAKREKAILLSKLNREFLKELF